MFAHARGLQQRILNVGGRGKDANQAVLSWDSMSTAGPFQRQSGNNGQGDGQHHVLCLERKSCVRQDMIRNMLRIVSTESCSCVNNLCVAVEDVLD